MNGEHPTVAVGQVWERSGVPHTVVSMRPLARLAADGSVEAGDDHSVGLERGLTVIYTKASRMVESSAYRLVRDLDGGES